MHTTSAGGPTPCQSDDYMADGRSELHARFSPRAVIHLFLVLSVAILILLLGRLCLLSPDAAGATTAERRSEGEVDVLLRIQSNNERRNVDDLLADADVALADEDTGVVNRLGEAQLVNQGLEAALQEILNLEGQHVIQLHTRLVEHTDADQAANEGIAFEETLGVLLLEGEQLTAKLAAGSWRL